MNHSLPEIENVKKYYGQVATYVGGIPNSLNSFSLDDHHHFEIHKPMLVCGNTAKMLSNSRYSDYFRVTGDTGHHFGLFDCETINSSLTNDIPCACCLSGITAQRSQISAFLKA